MTASVPPPVPIDQRFAQLIQQFGLTKNSFAISLGKTASVVQHLIDGRNKPGYDLLCKVFEIYPNVSRDWLLLGRGPMLVSGEHTLKAPVAAAPLAAQPPLEPIDLSDVEVAASRRPGVGVAGTRLQPAEIAATLALAAAANQPARAAATTAASETVEPSALPQVSKTVAAPPAPTPTTVETPVKSQLAEAAPIVPSTHTAPIIARAAIAEAPIEAAATAPSPSIASPVSAAPASGAAPENYVAAALNAQYLQHQLALAELRNQHLLEQQQMLREMLAMARQAMV